MAHSTSTSTPHALIIGGGVIGLTTAYTLLQHGYLVTVIAKEYASPTQRITSQAAGALWEWPPSVCGSHTNETSLTKSKAWCMVSYEKFRELAEEGIPGVRMCMANFFFFEMVDENPRQKKKKDEIQAEERIGNFQHSAQIINDLCINEEYGIKDAYRYKAPVIDTDEYMFWLTKKVSAMPGARLYQLSKPVRGDITKKEAWKRLLARYEADLLINCAGLGSRELAGDDTVYPLRGALVRVDNVAIKKKKIITEAMCVSLDGRQTANDMVYLVPRNDNTVCVGGIAEKDQTSLDIDMESYPPLKKMYERNLKFLPQLADAPIDQLYSVAVGVRPARINGVRVEREPGAPIIHNYGHGGSGFTLSFGCAKAVKNLANEIIKEKGTTDSTF